MKLLLILLLLPLSVSADKLIIGGFSHHVDGVFDTRYEFNDSHPAIGYEWNKWEAGAYYNSVRKTSFFISRIDRLYHYEYFSLGYRVGLASGYERITWENEEGETIPTTFIKGGVMPQAQFIISHQSKFVTVDLGISLVSTLSFKLNL